MFLKVFYHVLNTRDIIVRDKKMEIAIFGDLHGKIFEGLSICRQWEVHTGKQLDLILQLGDMGIWPFTEKADKATRRHAKKDSGELGFQEFYTPSERVKDLFSQLQANLIFIPGNHEDFEYLKECATESPIFPVEPSKRLFCLKSGGIYQFGNLKIAGLGGIDKNNRKGKYHPAAYINEKDAEKLLNEKIDILITHESPTDACVPGKGSEDITCILRKSQPAFAFFAHYNEGPATAEITGCKTKIYHLNKYHHETQSISWGILSWEKQEFEYV